MLEIILGTKLLDKQNNKIINKKFIYKYKVDSVKVNELLRYDLFKKLPSMIPFYLGDSEFIYTNESKSELKNMQVLDIVPYKIILDNEIIY